MGSGPDPLLSRRTATTHQCPETQNGRGRGGPRPWRLHPLVAGTAALRGGPTDVVKRTFALAGLAVRMVGWVDLVPPDRARYGIRHMSVTSQAEPASMPRMPPSCTGMVTREQIGRISRSTSSSSVSKRIGFSFDSVPLGQYHFYRVESGCSIVGMR